MKVLKFGGSSVGTPERLKGVGSDERWAHAAVIVSTGADGY